MRLHGPESETRQNTLGRFLLFTIAAIVYGSLFPFHFGARPEFSHPLWTVIHHWPRIDHSFYRDAVVNVLLYVPLGVLAFAWLRQKLAPLPAAALALGAGALLSFSMEYLQAFDRPREPSPTDVLTNALGMAAGIALARIYQDALSRASRHPVLQAAFRPSGAWLLLLLWAGSELSPFFPTLSPFVFRHRLAGLANLESFAWIDAATSPSIASSWRACWKRLRVLERRCACCRSFFCW